MEYSTTPPETSTKSADSDEFGNLDDLVQRPINTEFSDLSEFDPEHPDTITEGKPIVTCTVTVPKSSGEHILAAVTDVFASLSWVRYVEVENELDIKAAEDSLQVTGDYYITAHLPSTNIPAEVDAVETAVAKRIERCTAVTHFDSVSLKMPPYLTQKY